jgi:DNA repair exonuclease SbcCD ATPase subunit
MASNDIKEYSILLKQFERRDFDAEIHSCKTEYESLKSEYDLYDKQKTVLLVKKTKYEEQIIDLAKKITPVDKSIVDIKTLEQQKTETEKLIPELESEINQLLNNLSEKESYYNKITSFVDKLKSMNIESDYEKVILLENKLQSINVEIDKFNIQIKNKLDKADKLLKVEYDPNCKFCMNNIFVKDAIVAKQELINDKKLYDEMIANRSNFILELEPLSKTKDLYDKLYKAKSAISQTKMEILQLKNIISEKQNEMQSKKTYLLQINDDIDKYHKNKEYIESNKKIESDINNIKEQISKLNLDIDGFETNIRQKHSKMILLDEKIKSINNDINEFKKMEQEYNCYNYYLKCVNRDSIPYQLILKIIPAIESEINNILSQMVDFTIMLDVDNKNINIKIVYSEDRFWSVEMASGMERFITGISIRMALLSISNLPRPNFLAVDEGFSTLDANNMSNLPLIFDYLRSQMDFILIISHLDHIRDFVDLSLDLKKENDFSKITFK